MKTKRILSLLMAGALLTGALTGCGSKKDDSAQSGDNSGVITINYPTFQCGTNTSAPVCDELIKEFNEKYAGKYEIKKEDVLEGTVFGYRAGYQQPRRQDLRFLDGRPGYRLLLQQGPV